VFYGHLVSAADPTVRRIAPRPAPTPAAGSKPSTLDKALQVLALRIPGRQDVDALSVTVRLAETGTVKAWARVRVRGGAARLFASRRAVARVAPNETRRLRLRLRRTAVKRIKRALRRGVRVRARVSMSVTDLAGNARTKTGLVDLRR
jgi:hypothetical protein